MKQAISVTIAKDNLLWLRGQAARTAAGNVSEIVNRLISDARSAGRAHPGTVRSVAGTIDLPDEDSLTEASRYVKALFDQSLNRPMLLRERPPKPRGRRG
jgi:hypothetical protein